MDKWRDFVARSDVDLWTMIENCLSLAHLDHYDQLRLRRDSLAELMFGPRLQKGSDGGSVRNGSSDKTNASSGVYKPMLEDNEDVENDPQHSEDGEEDEEEEEEGGHGGGEESGKEMNTLDDYEDGERGAHDSFDDDVEALADDIERENLVKKEINSLKQIIDRVPAKDSLPVQDAMDILYRVQELNISVDALKDTKIGKSISRLARKHPVESVRERANEIVSSWKDLVDEYYEGIPATAANDDAGPMGEEEVGLPSPPLDEGGLVAARTVEISDIFNFSESDLSAASGPSPASEGPSAVHHTGRKSSSSPDQEHVGREGKGVARIVKIDKHRPVYMEGKPDQDYRNQSSGSIRMGPSAPSQRAPSAPSQRAPGAPSRRTPSAPSQRAPSQVRSSYTATTSEISPLMPERPRQVIRGSTAIQSGGGSKEDARPTPNVVPISQRVETTKPGLATRVEPLLSDIDAAIMHSKRQLKQGYASHANAKKQRTTQTLTLADLPAGGPKAQKPGRPWVRTK